MMKNLFQKERWTLIPILLLGLIFIIRLIDEAKLLFYFPLDYHNDVSAYMALLHFLKVCGFHNYCQYWFNGFTTFQFTSPGWFFFALPLYYIFSDVKITAYASLIISFILSFFIINHFLKDKIDLKKRILMFLLIFANATAIGNFIRLGRPPILLGWTLFILLFLYLIKKIDNPINKYAWIIIPLVSAALILIHYIFLIFIPVIFLGCFIIKDWREKIKIIAMGLLSIVLSSFWLLPFLINIKNSTILGFSQGTVILRKFSELGILNNLMFILVPLGLIILYYLYSKQKSKNERLFHLPIIVLSLLFLLKLTAFIPILDTIGHDHYIMLFIILGSYFLVEIDFKKLSKALNNILKIAITLISIASVLVTIFYTPWFVTPNDQANKELKELIPHINGTLARSDFITETSYGKAYDSYIPIYYNKSIVFGWYYEETTNEYTSKYQILTNSIKERNCKKTLEHMKILNVTNYLGYNEGCKFMMDKCNQKNYITSGKACLVYIS